MSLFPDKQAAGHADPNPAPSKFKKHSPLILLALVLVLASLLRLQGIGWGLPTVGHPAYSYHPDEAPLILAAHRMAVDGVKRADFIYGGTLFFRMLAIPAPLNSLLDTFSGGHGKIGNAILFWRLFMTLVALISILFLYRIGAILFNRRVGILAALLLAVVPAHVVWAQRVRPDEIAALFAIVLFYLAVKLYRAESHRHRYLFAAAFVTGIAVAFRFPLALFGIPAVVAYGLRDWKGGTAWRLYAKHFGLAFVCAVIGYLVGSPQSLSSPHSLIAGMQYQWSFQSGAFPYAIGRGPGIYQYAWTMMVMAVGHPIYVLALAGAVVGLRRRDPGVTLVFSALLPYLLLTSFTSWVVVRYLVPLVPFMALLAAYLCEKWLFRGSRPVVAALAVSAAVLWVSMVSFAYTRMEKGADTRDLAATWIMQNLPSGSVVVRVLGYPGDFASNVGPLPGMKDLVLSLKKGVDPAQLLDVVKPQYVVVGGQYMDELARLGPRYPSARVRRFYNALLGGAYTGIHRVTNPPEFMGINLQALFSSVDYRVANPTIYIYQRIPGM
ncbi:MAG: glycosyltransferase family 39 protein [Acidiferrobacteraceae bacterium]|jgi:hypothetical protein